MAEAFSRFNPNAPVTDPVTQPPPPTVSYPTTPPASAPVVDRTNPAPNTTPPGTPTSTTLPGPTAPLNPKTPAPGGVDYSGAYQNTWRTDPGYIGYQIGQWAKLPGADPSLTADPAYWTKRITETGGLGPDNMMYWQGRAQGQGGDVGSGPKTAPPGGPVPFGSNLGGPLAGDSKGLFEYLMGRAKQSLAISPDDPIIKQQVDAYGVTQQQNQRNYLSDVAEKGMGGPGVNTEAAGRSSSEKIGQNVSQFQAGLMGQELTARRQEIEQALSGASGLLTAEQAMALQEELGQLNIAQQAYSTDQNFAYLNSPLAH